MPTLLCDGEGNTISHVYGEWPRSASPESETQVSEPGQEFNARKYMKPLRMQQIMNSSNRTRSSARPLDAEDERPIRFVGIARGLSASGLAKNACNGVDGMVSFGLDRASAGGPQREDTTLYY